MWCHLLVREFTAAGNAGIATYLRICFYLFNLKRSNFTFLKMNSLFHYLKVIINLFRRQRIKVLFNSNNIIIVDKDYDMKINSNDDAEVMIE